ncbi:MAG: hypothetical protein WBN40_08070, partial [Pseudomonadales bacterium]
GRLLGFFLAAFFFSHDLSPVGTAALRQDSVTFDGNRYLYCLDKQSAGQLPAWIHAWRPGIACWCKNRKRGRCESRVNGRRDWRSLPEFVKTARQHGLPLGTPLHCNAMQCDAM